ncbi:Plasma membrane fusion protein PRM1 [Mycena indigotica]|uniref:Plasma membrane fusion protein PRM1 n=1 Tax=Mycena indigotica TaxID=2126181 RepID=A0A8H6SIC2_9AGAR|nr:Plasma membrane fusion protein PRM1 [Mycena indigotica]KAF7298887.1 Plasma membrane fusion protein PRM1 [Mycena indigotica]
MTITHIVGDLFAAPTGSILVHACNTRGSWGAGIAAAFKQRFPDAFAEYQAACKKDGPALLGSCLLIRGVEYDVACLFTSKDYGKRVDSPDQIIAATQSAVAHLIVQNKDPKKALHACRFNSGKFGVAWDRTADVLNGLEVDIAPRHGEVPPFTTQHPRRRPTMSWNAAPPTYDAPTTRLQPYLELPHLLSLTWLAYPILSLVFVAFRLSLSLSSSQDAVVSAKADFVASCKAAEKAATAAASMPRYMALATNERIANAVNDSMNAARATLILALTIMEVVINFIIDLYRSTFLCFLELVIRGGLAILIGAVQELNAVVQAAAGGLRTVIQDSFGAANSALQDVAKVASKIGISIPTLSVPDLSSLQNVTLPQSFTDSLTSLNNSLPTFQELKKVVEELVDTPFELLKKDINETFSGLSFNSSVLAVPQQNTLEFCTDLDTSFIDDLGRDLAKMTKIGIIIIIAAILLLIALNCLLEWYKWRCQQRHLEYTRQAWATDPTIYHQHAVGAPTVTLSDHNLLMLEADGSHPLLTRIANNISAKLRLSTNNHIRFRWSLHYIFHPPALACFLIGFFGLLSVELQLLAMGPLVAKYSNQAASTTADFSNTIATSINASMYNQSATYAASVNGHVDSIQNSVNQGLFGWVNTTTTTLNTTIENFYEDVQNAVEVVFKNTILDAPIQEFIKCLIGTKVDAIENALTFLHDNLHIDIPRVNDSVLVLSPASVNEATQPIAAAALGSGDGKDDGGLVGRLVNGYAASLRKERIMFGIFMMLWGLVVLMALAIVLWDCYGRRRQRLPAAFSNPEHPSTSFPPLAESKEGSGFRPFALVRSAAHSDQGSFFEKPKSTRSNLSTKEISKPMKLLGRREREVYLGDQTTRSSLSLQSQVESRPTGWFGRVAGVFSKKQEVPTIEPYPAFAPNRNSDAVPSRPTLTITTNDQASRVDSAPAPEAPTRSRWSVSPQNTAVPWGRASIWGKSPTSNVNPNPTGLSPLAMPLHSGFEAPGNNVARMVLPSQPPHHPVSVPSADPFDDTNSSPSDGPVTRLLTTTNARRSSPVDPFVTPFDDEHRVTISHVNARKSIPTNPFATPTAF